MSKDNKTPPKQPLPHQQSKGYPVAEGQTWQDLTPEQRRDYFLRHEQRWKGKFNSVPGQSQDFRKG